MILFSAFFWCLIFFFNSAMESFSDGFGFFFLAVFLFFFSMKLQFWIAQQKYCHIQGYPNFLGILKVSVRVSKSHKFYNRLKNKVVWHVYFWALQVEELWQNPLSTRWELKPTQRVLNPAWCQICIRKGMSFSSDASLSFFRNRYRVVFTPPSDLKAMAAISLVERFNFKRAAVLISVAVRSGQICSSLE